MKIDALKTIRVEPHQDLYTWLDAHVPSLQEDCVLAITSKVVSLCEGRVISKTQISKKELVYREADKVIPSDVVPQYDILLTLKDRLLIPSAGIDESNGNGYYILYPKDCFAAAERVWHFLREHRQIKHLGILITDSHTTPLRRGVTGVALAWWGFDPMYSCIGKADLYDQALRVTYVNLVDALAVGAVFAMGESNECTPLALLSEIPKITFNESHHTIDEIAIDPTEDLYRPLLKPLL